MGWDKEKIDWVANLAKLELTSAEQEKFSENISAILGYVGELQQIDVSEVGDIGQITGLANQLAQDNVKECNIPREQLLVNSPAQDKGYIKVKSVLGRET